MRLAIACLVGGILLPTAASAQTFCSSPPFQYMPGQPVTASMKVVASTVARPSEIPGKTPVNFCSLAFRSRHPFYKPISVTTKPQRGEIQHGSYSVRYRSKNVGPDTFTFVIHHMDPINNAIRDTPVTVNVEVVAAPF